MKSTVTVILPTYNRPEAVEYLIKHFPFFSDNRIVLQIHDSSNNSQTKKVVENLNERIEYFCYDSDIDPDTKLFNAINRVNTDYLWVISDGVVIKKNVFIECLDSLMLSEIDVIHIDCSDPYNLGYKQYENTTLFFKECFWSVTGYGSTIIRTDKLQRLKDTNYEHYLKKNYSEVSAFLWPCMIFDVFSDMDCKIAHIMFDYFDVNPYKKSSSWLINGNALEIWVDTLIDDVDRLPHVYNCYKESVCRSVWDNTGLNSIKKQLSMRRYSCLTYNKLIKRINNGYLPKVTNKTSQLLAISMIPTFILKVAENIYHHIKHRRRKY